MMELIRRFRRMLRLVHYYSADRSYTIWSQAVAIALLASLPTAMIAVIVLNATIRQIETGEHVTGRLSRDAAGGLNAQIVSDPMFSDYSGGGRMIGEFTMWVPIHRHGWPIVTSNRPQPAQLGLNLYDQANTRIGVRLGEDSAIWQAIEEALVGGGHRAMLEAYHQPRPPGEQLWLGWTVGTLMLWAMLAVLLPLLILMTRVASLLVLERRARRVAALRAKGLCIRCGYDLRGLEFNDRCPECGVLLE
ncbi:MAG: hypothetical protein JSV91_07445 [Phycisphaerales bacterium]|nr:MAG: hypothetical protein JSV91_07445 [Phycisphaerales bacterium]